MHLIVIFPAFFLLRISFAVPTSISPLPKRTRSSVCVFFFASLLHLLALLGLHSGNVLTVVIFHRTNKIASPNTPACIYAPRSPRQPTRCLGGSFTRQSGEGWKMKWDTGSILISFAAALANSLAHTAAVLWVYNREESTSFLHKFLFSFYFAFAFYYIYFYMDEHVRMV